MSPQHARPASHAGTPKLLDRLRTAIRLRHFSRRTEEAYVGWTKRSSHVPVVLTREEVVSVLGQLSGLLTSRLCSNSYSIMTGEAIASTMVSLRKMQGQLQDAGALETIAHYLALMEEAFLVAPLGKHATRAARQREEPLEVDAVLDGSWGSWAIEVKTGSVAAADLKGLGEFTQRYRQYRPLVLCDDAGRPAIERLGLPAMAWQDFLIDGHPGVGRASEGPPR